MSSRIIIGLLLISASAIGQGQDQKDSLINEMCKTISLTKDLPDTTRILTTYEKHLYPFLSSYPEEESRKVGTSIYYRFQRDCKEFKQLLDGLNPPKGDWETVTDKPNTKITKKLCRQFIEHKNYSYIESTGDTVHLQIDNKVWIDHFKDGTFSKLKLVWVSDCEFDIEFIESNNETRKNFSRPGDKYRYLVVDKKMNYYDMSVEILGTETYLIFKMYY